MAFFSSEDIELTSPTATLIDLGSTDQTEEASMPRSVQVSNKITVSKFFLSSSGYRDDHSLSLRFSVTKKLAKLKE